MLTVTDAARARLARKLRSKNPPANRALRFARNDGRPTWGIHLDKIDNADVVYAHEGRTVLVVDEQASQMLNNKVLYVRETEEGPRLRLRKS